MRPRLVCYVPSLCLQGFQPIHSIVAAGSEPCGLLLANPSRHLIVAEIAYSGRDHERSLHRFEPETLSTRPLASIFWEFRL
jgi:hypothetical protein